MSIIVRGSMITLPSGLVGRVSSKKKNGWLRVGVNTPNGRKVISVRNCGFVKPVVEAPVVEAPVVEEVESKPEPEGVAHWRCALQPARAPPVPVVEEPKGVSPGDTITLPSGLVGRVETTNTNGWMTVSVVTANGHNVISVRNYNALPNTVAKSSAWTHGDNIRFRTLKTRLIVERWQNGTIDKVLDDGWVRVYNDDDSGVHYVLDNITYLKTSTK
jgi:preprotein translocase subunit YajC